MDLNELINPIVSISINFRKNVKNSKSVFCMFTSILLISRQYRRHFHNEREIPHILVMSNLNFDKIEIILQEYFQNTPRLIQK